jgi:TPR repeat protein
MEPRTHGYSDDPRVDGYDQDINDPRFAPYRYARSGRAKTDAHQDEPVPLFLSTLAEQARQRALEEAWEGDRREEYWEADARKAKKIVSPGVVSRRIVKTGILAAAGIAAAFAFLALDDRSGLVDKASASLAAILPTFSSAFGRSSTPTLQTVASDRAPATTPAPATAVAPTRAAISNAFQTALQSQPQQDIQQPQVALTTPPPRRLDPDELAALLKRATGLIDTGDIAAARLLLERAADAHEPKAALILAQTYDPAVLGTPDARSIAPDPAAARVWYQRAAQFGSQDAQRRLDQMQK